VAVIYKPQHEYHFLKMPFNY